MGIEPTSSAWEAEVLPLNYTRTKRFKTLLTPKQSFNRNRTPKIKPAEKSLDRLKPSALQ